MAEKEQRHRIIIFHASEEPNSNGELNWIEESTISKDQNKALDDLQKIIGGDIELIHHPNSLHTEFIALCDKEGLLKDKRRNDLAGGTLYYLGFDVLSLPLGCAYAGTVVLLGKRERSLTDKQIIIVKKAMNKYLSEEF